MTTPETASLLTAATGRQFLELLISPNGENKRWAETPLGEQLFTSSMQAIYRDFVGVLKVQLQGAPVQVSHVLTELMIVVLHRRITEMHGSKMDKVLGDKHGEPWEQFIDNLHDLAQLIAQLMLEYADERIAEFVELATRRLAQLPPETSAGGAHHG